MLPIDVVCLLLFLLQTRRSAMSKRFSETMSFNGIVDQVLEVFRTPTFLDLVAAGTVFHSHKVEINLIFLLGLGKLRANFPRLLFLELPNLSALVMSGLPNRRHQLK